MSNAIETILSQLGEGGLEQLASKVGADKSQVSGAIEQAIPTLMSAISKNTQNAGGASGFLSALDRDHDGSILDDIGALIQNPDAFKGNGILQHILGDKQGNVEQQLSAQSGISGSGMHNLLQMIAPLVMGYLGKQKKENAGGFDMSDISAMIGNLSGGKGLDLSDVIQQVSGGKGGGILGMLGNLFGRK